MAEKNEAEVLATMMFYDVIGKDPKPGTDAWDLLNGVDKVPSGVSNARLDDKKVYLLPDFDTNELYWYFMHYNWRFYYTPTVIKPAQCP